MKGIYWMGRFLPMYGIMIAIGILAAGFVGYFMTERQSLSGDDFLILGAYTVCGGLLGAKVLSLVQNYHVIEWNRMLDLEYLKLVLQGGYVFYGGVIGGGLLLLLGGKIHGLSVLRHLEAAIPCIPLAHAFGRVGCHFASCCYGIPYDGPGSIIYHAPAYAPVEISLFPVQLLEAGLNLVLAVILILYISKKGCTGFSICIYGFSYAVIRFFLEYLRYDIVERGKILIFSTSQWISLFLFFLTAIFCPLMRKKDEHM